MVSKRYNEVLKRYARENRINGTKGEAVIWKYVLSKKQTGYQFNRQFVIGRYIVDFISRKLKLIIEIDGNSHKLNENSNDNIRQLELEELGYTFLRFDEYQVLKKEVSVLLRNVVFESFILSKLAED